MNLMFSDCWNIINIFYRDFFNSIRVTVSDKITVFLARAQAVVLVQWSQSASVLSKPSNRQIRGWFSCVEKSSKTICGNSTTKPTSTKTHAARVPFSEKETLSFRNKFINGTKTQMKGQRKQEYKLFCQKQCQSSSLLTKLGLGVYSII